MKEYFSISLALLLVASSITKSETKRESDTIRVIKIWDQDKHNAFADAAYFTGTMGVLAERIKIEIDCIRCTPPNCRI